MDLSKARATAFALATTLIAACMPEATGTLAFQSNPATKQLFDCAQSAVNSLHARDEQWNTHVTTRDPASGHFETGQFDESNVMGYRVRLTRVRNMRHVEVRVRAAGPYFTDLGAETALIDFNTAVATCLAQPARTRAQATAPPWRAAEIR